MRRPFIDLRRRGLHDGRMSLLAGIEVVVEALFQGLAVGGSNQRESHGAVLLATS